MRGPDCWGGGGGGAMVGKLGLRTGFDFLVVRKKWESGSIYTYVVGGRGSYFRGLVRGKRTGGDVY